MTTADIDIDSVTISIGIPPCKDVWSSLGTPSTSESESLKIQHCEQVLYNKGLSIA